MNYVIVGCGRVGSGLAKLLVSEAHQVTVVDENPNSFTRLGQRFTGRVEVGTGIDYDVLKRAGVEAADGFVAVTDGDNRNVMAALIAKRMFGVRKVVARIYDPPRGQIYRELGIETVVPTTIVAKIMRDRLMHVDFEGQPSFDFGKVSSITVTLVPALHGKTVSELERANQVRIAAYRRGNSVRVPTPQDVLEAGDEINAIVAPESLSEFVAPFARDNAPLKVSA